MLTPFALGSAFRGQLLCLRLLPDTRRTGRPRSGTPNSRLHRPQRPSLGLDHICFFARFPLLSGCGRIRHKGPGFQLDDCHFWPLLDLHLGKHLSMSHHVPTRLESPGTTSGRAGFPLAAGRHRVVGWLHLQLFGAHRAILDRLFACRLC